MQALVHFHSTYVFILQTQDADILSLCEVQVRIQDYSTEYKFSFPHVFRMVCTDLEGKAERKPERCQLQINVTPGMRGGTQFIFECEGDELPGVIPSDVCVTLVLEPHTR